MSDPRRELGTACATVVVAGGLALSAGGQAWARVTVQRPLPLPPVAAALTGSQAAPLVPAAGLVLLAAAVALLALRSVGRAAVGLLCALAGGLLAWSGIRAMAGSLSDAATQLPTVGRGAGPVTVRVSAAWPIVAVVAGLLGVAAGLFVVLRGRTWPAMGRKYERAGAGTPAPRTDEERAQAAWRALDRGEDPTDSAGV